MADNPELTVAARRRRWSQLLQGSVQRYNPEVGVHRRGAKKPALTTPVRFRPSVRLKAPPQTAALLAAIDRSKFGAKGRKLLDKAIKANRPVTAGAVPGLGQAVRALAQGVRSGGIGQTVRGLKNPLRTSIPRSAAPITPGMRLSGEVARNASSSDSLRPAPRPAPRRGVSLLRPSRRSGGGGSSRAM